MKKEERKHRIALTLLLSAFVFFIILFAFLISAAILYVMVETDFIFKEQPSMWGILLFIGIVSTIIGAAITAVLSKHTLWSVNNVINQMNRLASGDFKARLKHGRFIAVHPTFVEVAESFNKMAEELENTEMLRSDFVNNFSHEFKTPIVSISGFAKLLKKDNLTDEQRKEYLDIIEEESLRLSYMATNVLNLTKLENQAILTDVTQFNLSEQIRNCVLLLESKWEKKKLELYIDFDEYIISANEEMLKQVWINLLENAVKFAPDYGVIEVDIKQEKDKLKISVSNSGSEIAPENIESIFKKFYQADKSRSSEGNGIGLAIVKRVTELHGGEVSAKSENLTTVFTVTLPTSTPL